MLILSPEQQELLRSYAHREVPEGSMTFKALADKFGVDITTIGHWVRVAGDTLGDIIVIDDHARKGSPYRILSPEQQELLRTTFLTQAEKIEGYMTVKEVARHLNTTHTIIKRRIKEGASSLGEIKMLQRGRERLLYLSPDQVKILEQIHSEKKIISYIPPGYATTTEVCNTLGIAYGRLIYIVYRILSESELGSLSRYHGGTRVPPQLIFSPEQQELIAEKNDQIERRGGHAVIAAARKEGSQSS